MRPTVLTTFIMVLAASALAESVSSFTCTGNGCLQIGMLMRFTGMSPDGLHKEHVTDMGNGWRTVAAAALLAAKHFNTRDSTLIPRFGELASCDVRINVSSVDNTASDPSAAVNAYLKGASRAGQCDSSSGYWHMVIGAARSACSTPVAMLGGLQKVPQISYWSTSPDLDGPSYPYFARTIPPDSATVVALTAFIASNSWNKAGMIHIKDAWGNGLATALSKEFTTRGMTLATAAFDSGAQESIDTAAHQLQSSAVKIILCLTFEADFLPIMRAAVERSIVGNEFHWIYGTGYAWDTISEEVLVRAVQGSTEIEAMAGVDGYAPWDTMKRNWASNSEDEFNVHMPQTSWGQLSPGFFEGTANSVHDVAAYAYDAVATAGLAACGAAPTAPHSALNDPDELMRKLKSLDYSGVSGRVRFSEWASRSGDTGNFFVLNNRLNATSGRIFSVAVGRYVAASGSFDYGCAICAGDGVMYSDGSFRPPSDTWPEEEQADMTAVIVVCGVLSGLLFVSCLGFLGYRNRKIASGRAKKALIQSMQEEIRQLTDSLVGTVVITQDFAPNGLPSHSALDYIRIDMPTSLSPPIGIPATAPRQQCLQLWGSQPMVARASQPMVARADSHGSTGEFQWYWEESKGREGNHPAHMVIDEVWVAYEPSNSALIEDRYLRWTKSHQDPSLKLTIHGVEYMVDLTSMTQTRVSTGYSRPLRRLSKDKGPSTVPALSRKQSGPDLGEETGPIPVGPVQFTVPEELKQETQLVAFTGAIVQVSKSRDDGWSYGNVVFTPNENPPVLSEDLWSLDAGWFPDSISRPPVAKDLEQLSRQMGGGGAECLKPPDTWTPTKDPLLAECVASTPHERAEVEAAFMQTAPAGTVVSGVERVQNISMWQSYAVKRQTILEREQGEDQARLERRWLFHGTNAEVLDKIVQQGFNRSFCGKNATAYGKGVYFARDARYSCNRTYSAPDSRGMQHMFACRVTVGEFCQGTNNALTPDVRTGNVLYDSTVDSPQRPGIFVTYHDAQAYPEYIIHFKVAD